VISTVNSVGVNTTATYDACGRKTYESYPFDVNTPDPIQTNGTHYQYDPLHRVTLKTNPDSTQVQYAYLKAPSGAQTQVTDAGLKDIARLVKLFDLDLSGTQVTDAGLKHLASLENLSDLTLYNTEVTDAGLVHLAGLKGLRHLSVYRTLVTDAGVAELQKSLPNCRIGN
jgi:hypothetical protein